MALVHSRPRRLHCRLVRRAVLGLGVCVAFTVGASCASDDGGPSSAPDATETELELTPAQQSLADVAIADLVERRSVDAADIVVSEVDEVTWSDSSFGCPQTGMQYLQVITPGIRVVLVVDGVRAFYHGTSAADLAYCATPQPPIPD